MAAIPEAGRDNASATIYTYLGIYTKWLVYSDMSAWWRCWQLDNGSNTLVRAVSGFLSVYSLKGLQLRWEHKCLEPVKVFSSSLSKVEKFTLVLESFLRQKQRGSTYLTWLLKAFVAGERTAPGRGWDKSTTATRAIFASANELDMIGLLERR